MDFLTQILPLILSGGGIGTLLGVLIEHKFAIQREDRAGKLQLERDEMARAFNAKKDVYGKLSSAIYNFTLAIPISIAKKIKAKKKTINTEDFILIEHYKELMKATAEATLYANENTSKALYKIDTDAYNYIKAHRESLEIMKAHEEGTPKYRKAAKEQDDAMEKFSSVRKHLLEEMRKDLNVQ